MHAILNITRLPSRMALEQVSEEEIIIVAGRRFVGTGGGPSYTKLDSAGHAKLETSDTEFPRITVLLHFMAKY